MFFRSKLKLGLGLTGLLTFALFLFSGPFDSWAFDEQTSGYYLANMEAQMARPEDVLMGKKFKPSNAAVREYNWIIETLKYRCINREEILISTLLGTWRIVKSRGYDVPLLKLSRELLDFSGVVYQSYRNQRVDFQKVALKWIKDKYPQR